MGLLTGGNMAATVHPLYIGPGWFFGVDNIVNIFSILVCLLIFLFGYKVYRLTLNNNYKVFSYAFLLICVSYIFKVGTLAALYFATNNITPLEGVPGIGAVTTSVTAAMTISSSARSPWPASSA